MMIGLPHNSIVTVKAEVARVGHMTGAGTASGGATLEALEALVPGRGLMMVMEM